MTSQFEPDPGKSEPAAPTQLRPRLAAVRGHARSDPAHQRYALACASAAAASRVLVIAHATVGAPRQDVPESEVPLRRAVAQARTAAGAMCVVAGRLLTRVREDEGSLLPDLPSPVRPESGVTTPSLQPEMEVRLTVHALQGANAECAAAVASLTRCEAPEDMRRAMAELSRIADLMIVEYVDPTS